MSIQTPHAARCRRCGCRTSRGLAPGRPPGRRRRGTAVAPVGALPAATEDRPRTAPPRASPPPAPRAPTRQARNRAVSRSAVGVIPAPTATSLERVAPHGRHRAHVLSPSVIGARY
eukprot:3380755-Pyramimonas_sp.AAC.1